MNTDSLFRIILAVCFLLSESWFIAGFWLAGSVLAVATRLEKEEAMLLAQFGDDYRAYRRRTGRLLPRFGTVGHPGGGA